MTFQLAAPLIDACVLGVLSTEDTYGYMLTQKIKMVIDISESTLYPVLRRLEKNGFLSTYDKEYQGRNRRYYTITPSGLNQLSFYTKEWKTYKKHIDIFFSGGIKNES